MVCIEPANIRLHSRTSECENLYQFLADSLEDVPREIFQDLKVVAEELFTNIVQYAHRELPDLMIQVQISRLDGLIKLEFRDSGPAFNPLDEPVVDLEDIDLSEGGMGIHLITTLSDEQFYRRENDGNVFFVTKRYN